MFTHRDIQRIVGQAGLAGQVENSKLYGHWSKEERQSAFRSSIAGDEELISAAIEIQRVWRGYKARSTLLSIIYPSPSQLSSLLSSSYASPTFSEIRSSLNASQLSTRIHSSISKPLSSLQQSYHDYTEEFFKGKKNQQEQLLSFQGYCAYTIQQWYREWMVIRKRRKAAKEKQDALLAKRKARLEKQGPLTDIEAATIIQQYWRRHIDRQVFEYYKQLLTFKNKGDPKFMLKCINPKEAELLDSASGVHVRFRLGGEKFPPSIYYKIFTHRNVADIGAFAPRQYTKAENKEAPAFTVHNRGIDLQIDDTHDWYSRYENNGWRLVNDRIFKYQNHDAVTIKSSQKRIKVSHDKLIRRQDVEQRKKQRKIEWMRKMYSFGMLKSKEDNDESVTDLVATATKGLMMTVDDDGPEAVEEWEVDELLQWTEGLNFDSYSYDWLLTGTTSLDSCIAD